MSFFACSRLHSLVFTSNTFNGFFLLQTARNAVFRLVDLLVNLKTRKTGNWLIYRKNNKRLDVCCVINVSTRSQYQATYIFCILVTLFHKKMGDFIFAKYCSWPFVSDWRMDVRGNSSYFFLIEGEKTASSMESSEKLNLF